MPFPIQRIQTDRGTEFFAIKVQKYLLRQSIKFRPIKPGSPHLNGKVERSQKTDLSEFYPTIDFTDNHGPHRFMDHVRLEKGRVKKIVSGEYGY
jgi:transposase InsO family protein